MRDRRVGRFVIDFGTINDRPEVAKAVLAGVIITRAEAMFHSGEVVYVGVFDGFQGVAPGKAPPTYAWKVVKGQRVWIMEGSGG